MKCALYVPFSQLASGISGRLQVLGPKPVNQSAMPTRWLAVTIGVCLAAAVVGCGSDDSRGAVNSHASIASASSSAAAFRSTKEIADALSRSPLGCKDYVEDTSLRTGPARQFQARATCTIVAPNGTLSEEDVTILTFASSSDQTATDASARQLCSTAGSSGNTASSVTGDLWEVVPDNSHAAEWVQAAIGGELVNIENC